MPIFVLYHCVANVTLDFFFSAKKKKEKKKAINYCLDPFFYEMVIRGSRNLPKIVTLL